MTIFVHQSNVSREMPNARQVSRNMERRNTLDGSLINTYTNLESRSYLLQKN